MLTHLDKLNFNAGRFNEEISEKVENICAPLFSKFKITNFGYVKIFKDGTMFRISTDKNWSRKYFENQFYNDYSFYCFDDIPENGSRARIITNQPSGGVYTELYDHNIWNIFTLYERNQESANVWFFAAGREDAEMINFYINNRDILQDFMRYFLRQISKEVIIKQEMLIVTDLKIGNLKSEEENKIKEFLEEIGKNSKNKNFSLSVREIDCIQQLIRGKTAKEIASSLNISFRTVEFHINNAKVKAGCKKTGQLIKIHFESDRFLLPHAEIKL